MMDEKLEGFELESLKKFDSYCFKYGENFLSDSSSKGSVFRHQSVRNMSQLLILGACDERSDEKKSNVVYSLILYTQKTVLGNVQTYYPNTNSTPKSFVATRTKSLFPLGS